MHYMFTGLIQQTALVTANIPEKDGKILKSPLYFKPNISKILNRN